MTTIATSDVHTALARAAEQLLHAGGPDGIVSRTDIRAKLLSLEGVERDLVGVLYQFIDGRDATRSARITKSDIDAAVTFIKTELIDRHDSDRNGLSAEETAGMSDLGKLAVAVARKLKGATAPSAATTAPGAATTAPGAEATAPTGEALAQKLASLAQGLWHDTYGSESGLGLDAFHVAANLSQLTPDTFRAALGLTLDRPEHEIVKFEPADHFFERFVGTHWEDFQEQAEAVVKAMKTHLREPHAAIIGRDDPALGAEHPFYVVGIDAAGNLVGLKSAVVWT